MTARATGETVAVALKVPGLHNVANALAALSAAKACGVAARGGRGASRRVQRHPPPAGGRRARANDITVIDDFAHNPDKIAATLDTMHAFPGRLLLMFQPHGYGPIRLMRDALVECFASGMRDDDILVMPEPVYFGGTVDRSVGSRDIVADIERRGRTALALSRPPRLRRRAGPARPPRRSHRDHGRARRFAVAVRARAPAKGFGARGGNMNEV